MPGEGLTPEAAAQKEARRVVGRWSNSYPLLVDVAAALLAAEARGREQRAGEPERLALVRAVDAYEVAYKRREHLGSYGIRIQEAAQAFVEASRVAPKAAPPADAPHIRPPCENFCPLSWSGHWREYHRGHGCELDPTPTSAALARSAPPAPAAPTAPQDTATPTGKWHKCMRCGVAFACQTPGCMAGDNVLPRRVTADGKVVEHECAPPKAPR